MVSLYRHFQSQNRLLISPSRAILLISSMIFFVIPYFLFIQFIDNIFHFIFIFCSGIFPQLKLWHFSFCKPSWSGQTHCYFISSIVAVLSKHFIETYKYFVNLSMVWNTMDKISYKCVQRPMLTIATMINPNENMLTSSEMKKKIHNTLLHSDLVSNRCHR